MDMTEVTKFEPKVGTLKLSEAIRIGAKLRPKGRGARGGSCALEAAYEGLHGHPWTEVIGPYKDIERDFGVSRNLIDQIWMKNDNERMTRESIADWLESQGL